MSVAAIIALSDRPERKLAWAQYERDHAAWQASRDALSERLRTPAKRAYMTAMNAESDAFNAVVAYPAPSHAVLCEKIEIIVGHRDGQYVDPNRLFVVMADVRRLAREVRA